jgi:hypothetical protein
VCQHRRRSRHGGPRLQKKSRGIAGHWPSINQSTERTRDCHLLLTDGISAAIIFWQQKRWAEKPAVLYYALYTVDGGFGDTRKSVTLLETKGQKNNGVSRVACWLLFEKSNQEWFQKISVSNQFEKFANLPRVSPCIVLFRQPSIVCMCLYVLLHSRVSTVQCRFPPVVGAVYIMRCAAKAFM